MLRLIAVSGQIAWKALGRNRLRSGLTTLGVVIGVAAVIAMVALGNGARASVERTLKSAGTSIVEVSAGNFVRGGESMNIASGLGAATTLTRDDAAAIRELDNVEHVAAGLRSRTFVTASADARVFTLVQGTEPSLADIHGWTWLEGQGFTDADVAASAAKVVLGRIASARLFGEGVDPTGRKVTIHDREFEVVGMMRAVDADQDEAAFVPVTTLGALTSRTSWLQTITVGRHRSRRGHLGGRRDHRRCCATGTRRTSARPRPGPRARSAACSRPAAATAAWARPMTSR